MAKIWVEAYGYSASFSDSEMISGLIVNGGHTLATNSEESDLNVIVTCSVKDATAAKMVHRIKESNSKPLVVAGCLPKAEQQTVEKFAEKNQCKTFHCFAQDSYHEHIKGLNVLEDYTIKNCWPYWDKFEQRVPYNEPSLAADSEHYGVEHHERFASLFVQQFGSKLR